MQFLTKFFSITSGPVHIYKEELASLTFGSVRFSLYKAVAVVVRISFFCNSYQCRLMPLIRTPLSYKDPCGKLTNRHVSLGLIYLVAIQKQTQSNNSQTYSCEVQANHQDNFFLYQFMTFQTGSSAKHLSTTSLSHMSASVRKRNRKSLTTKSTMPVNDM